MNEEIKKKTTRTRSTSTKKSTANKPSTTKKTTTTRKKSTSAKKTVAKKTTTKKNDNSTLETFNNIIDQIDDIQTNLEESKVKEEPVIAPSSKKKKTTKKTTTKKSDNSTLETFNNIIDQIDDIQTNLEESKSIEEPIIIPSYEENKEDFELPKEEPKYEEEINKNIKGEEDYELPKEEPIYVEQEIEKEEITYEEPIKEEIPKKKKKLKKGGKIIILILLLLLVLGIGMFIFRDNIFGIKLRDYKNIISEVSFSKDLSIVEFKCVDDSLTNVVINTKMMKEMKENTTKYSNSIKNYLKEDRSNAYTVSNIEIALKLNLINENDTLRDYYYKIIGLDSFDELQKLFEEAIKDAKK